MRIAQIMIIWLAGLCLGHMAALAAPAESAADRAWIRAIDQNDVARLNTLAREREAAGLPVDLRNRKGKTILMAVAAAGDAAMVRKLIAGGADPAAVNHKGASTLMYAAWRGDQATIRVLLSHQVPLEQAASNGWTAMTMAAAKGHVDAVQLLLDAGAVVDPRDVYAWTPLMRACDLGRFDVARLLVSSGRADLSLINTRGQTALHLAAAAGHKTIYDWLVEAGADKHQADFNGRTPEQIAAAQH